MADSEENSNHFLSLTGDPFTDAAILEEQPTVLSSASIGREQNEDHEGVLEGNGIMERWSPRHERRGPANRRTSQTLRNSRRHSETVETVSSRDSAARNTPRAFPLLNQPLLSLVGSSIATNSSEALPGPLNPFRSSMNGSEDFARRNSRILSSFRNHSISAQNANAEVPSQNPFDTGSSDTSESSIEQPAPALLSADRSSEPFGLESDRQIVPFNQQWNPNLSAAYNPRIRTIADIERRRSSAVGPHAIVPAIRTADIERRRSSTVGPHAIATRTADVERRRSSALGPHTIAPAVRRGSNGHARNFSRPFDNALDEKEDTISALPSAVDLKKHVRFDPNFKFGDERRASESLAIESQEKRELESSDFKSEKRRRSSCVMVNRRASTYTIAEEKVVRAEGKKNLRWTRNLFMIWFVLVNAACIAVSWAFPKYWFVFVPVLLLGNVLNSLMVLNILRWWIFEVIKTWCEPLKREPTPPLPTHIPTTIAMVLACYCESYDEMLSTLESLNAQEKVGHHKKMFLIICDGQVKGKGAAKSTDRVLIEDIFKPDEELWFPVGYESWDGVINGIYACAGTWRGTPYVCLVKKRNLGKRDGLILVRTLLYKYEYRYDNQESIMGDDFFRWFCEFAESCGIQKFEWLVGVDADTTFNTECIYEMHKECLKSPALVGCSGLIEVGFRTGKWNLWNIYQNTEYIRAQLLRRFHQAHGTGKVSCLPGACQIIKICEETCGDAILIDAFGALPDPKANMIHQVRALAGEDRNYICLIFERYPKTRTTMSLNAIAYTDPPNGLMVFLSQRKRWTLSTCANDILIVTKNTMNLYERLNSLADILTWGLPIFVAQTFFLFLKACIFVTDPTFIVCFAIVTMIPISYAFVATFWGLKGWESRGQYLLGLFMVIAIGQFVTPVVITYAIWHMDNFSWGKTREVESDGDPANKPAHSD